MYELYRDRLVAHFQLMEENINSDVRVTFRDVNDRVGLTVVSQLKVYQRSQNGCGRLKYTINMYHTNNRSMVNGRQAAQFNCEHAIMTECILNSEQVVHMDRDMLIQIKESLEAISVLKTHTKKHLEILISKGREGR